MKQFTPKVSLAQLREVENCDYTKKTPTRKHLVLVDGRPLYLADPLTNGNSKLGKDVLCFDLLAVITCPNCADCRKGCYAVKAQRQYPATWNKRLINTILALRSLPTLEKLIRNQLMRTKKRIVRIHSSGDFFNQAYLDMWGRIIPDFPEIQFYTYTKATMLWWEYLDDYPNMNVVESVLPDGSVNFGDDDYLDWKVSQFPHIPVCPVTLGEEGAECMRTCKACLGCKFVMFKQH